jgi:glutamate/aspartate transport system substrate-binding protein
MRKAVLLTAVLLALPPAPPALAQEGTLDKIARTKTIVLGYREAEPPFSYRTPDGVTGFSDELCRRIAAAIKQQLELDELKVDYKFASPATRFILVRSGEVDLECTATTNTAERRKIVDFSYPHYLTATRFVSRRADNIKTTMDLAGRSVTSASGTVNIAQLNALNQDRKLNIAVIPAKTNEEAFDLVVQDRAAAFVMDDVLLAAMVARSAQPSRYVLSDEVLSRPEPYGLMMRRDDAAFKAIVNQTLARIFTSGEINAIYARWFTSPIQPSGINLNLPMPAALQNAYAHPVDYQD